MIARASRDALPALSVRAASSPSRPGPGNRAITLALQRDKTTIDDVRAEPGERPIYRGQRNERYVEHLVGKESRTGVAAYDWGLIGDLLHVTVKIRFVAAGAKAAEIPARVNGWLADIKENWNTFHLRRDDTGEVVWLRFFPEAVDSGEHHVVRVRPPGSFRDGDSTVSATADEWPVSVTVLTAAHEFGHLLGAEDENARTAADLRRIRGGRKPDGFAVMDSETLGYAQVWNVRQFADLLGRVRGGAWTPVGGRYA